MAKNVTDLLVVTYTHSNAFDVVPYYVSRMNKHTNIKNVFLTNEIITSETCFLYDDSKPFSEEYARFLETIENEFVIFSQEDQILYSNANEKIIDGVVEFLKYSKYAYCRLIRQQNSLIPEDKCLFLSEPKFSMQPTIWKRTELLSILKSIKVDKINDEPRFDIVMDKFPGLFYYNNENKRGLAHYDSSVWPYIATAIVKGKWNFLEYDKELNDLFQEFSIITTRART